MLKKSQKRMAKAFLTVLAWVSFMAILLALSTGCSTTLVPTQKIQVPKELTQKSYPGAESFCQKVQNYLKSLAESTGNAQ